ncbi:MAG: serine--tRNA ligase [Planctomycetota bacterium]
MLDVKLIREQPEVVKAGALKKRFPDRVAVVDSVLELDRRVRELIPQIDRLRAEQKSSGKHMGKLGDAEREAYLAAQRELKSKLQVLEEQEKNLQLDLRGQLLLLPQVPDPEVPEGKDDSENVEVRRVGEVKDPGFPVRAHDDLAEAQGWLDVKRAAELAGSRNYLLFSDLTLLHDAVLRLAVDHMVARGFNPVDPPLLVRRNAMQGTAFFPGGEEQTYACERDELFLIGTAEVPVTSIHGDEILDEADLPKRYVARSACFRREAGTYGRDTKGFYRVHQFHKVEQVVIDVADEARSKQHHADILRNSEELLQALELPYRVVSVCGGDLGIPQVMKYDIEAWMPSRGAYGETHSASRFHDFQARRLNMRYRRADKKVAFCHTLNNTVVASPRILIPLLEVHQLGDGRVRVPAVLRPYLQGREVLGRAL